jgi:hypothetical protein
MVFFRGLSISAFLAIERLIGREISGLVEGKRDEPGKLIVERPGGLDLLLAAVAPGPEDEHHLTGRELPKIPICLTPREPRLEDPGDDGLPA